MRWLIEFIRRVLGGAVYAGNIPKAWINFDGTGTIHVSEQFEQGYDRRRLRKQLSTDEARRTHLYQDSVGIWTIGVGHNIQERGLSERVIDLILDEDIEVAEQDVHALYPEWRRLNATRQEVLLNMAFNMGRETFAGFKLFWAAVRDGNHKEAKIQMLDSKWAGQVGVRAKRLARKWETARDTV